MIECRSGACFLLEAVQAIRIGGTVGGQKLDRDIAPKSGIARSPNFAHAACADLRDDGAVCETSIGGNGFAHVLFCTIQRLRRFHRLGKKNNLRVTQ